MNPGELREKMQATRPTVADDSIADEVLERWHTGPFDLWRPWPVGLGSAALIGGLLLGLWIGDGPTVSATRNSSNTDGLSSSSALYDDAWLSLSNVPE